MATSPNQVLMQLCVIDALARVGGSQAQQTAGENSSGSTDHAVIDRR